MAHGPSNPVPAAPVAFRNIGGRVVIVDPRENKMISLNETGSFIWESLDGRDAKTIAREIQEKFDVPFENALADLSDFIAELGGKGLIVSAQKKGDFAD